MQERARAMRHEATLAETKLWRALRNRQVAGAKFRRQVPLGRFIADFVCLDLRLVIEVDGGQHADSGYDRARDEWLAGNAFKVLRFWNNEVLENLDGVLTRISSVLCTTPHPARPMASPPSPTRGVGKKKPSPARGEGPETGV